MNSIIRNLIVAAPLATAALTMVPTSAMASDAPVDIIVKPHVDPQPKIDKLTIPESTPPVGPKDKIALPDPEGPVGPDDKVGPKPKPTHPDGPDDVTNPAPCPTHGDCGDDKDGPNDGGGKDNTPGDKVDVPTRIDAGLADEQSDSGLELTWLLAGGALVTATGAAVALRARKRQTV